MICFGESFGTAATGKLNMLTRKQAELLRFIHERLKEAGVPPSFISSKEGGTPASLRRSWIKRKSSACLRVSIGASLASRLAAKTNHEHTLSVPYVFRNHLI